MERVFSLDSNSLHFVMIYFYTTLDCDLSSIPVTISEGIHGWKRFVTLQERPPTYCQTASCQF